MARCSSPVASEDYADFIFLHSSNPPETLYSILGTECVDIVSRDYAIVYYPRSEVLPLSLSKYSYASIPKLYTPLDTTSMDASGITASFAQPTLSTKGEGIIIGIIDTGIQYENTLFRNRNGSTRILGIWDQTIPSPAGSQITLAPGNLSSFLDESILYGTEYTEEEINQALASPSPRELVPSTDTNGHGTFLAGIAAGSETEDGSFFGAAPECRIGIVKLKPAKQYLRDFYLISRNAEAYQENDIMMGMKYLLSLASKYGRPIIILLGMGTNYGSHDGTSPLGLSLRLTSNYNGFAAVVAGGNESGYRHHHFGRIDQDSDYEDVEIRVAEGEPGFILELWSREPELYTVGFVSPTGENIQRIPLVLGRDNRITFLLEPAVITINYIMAESGSGSQLIFMRFEAPTPGIWHVRVYNSLYISGQFHMWLPVHGFLSEETVFLRADPDTTITEPGNTPSVITVGGYNHDNNSIYIHSSRGFSRDGNIKPELVAPAVDVSGPALTRPLPPVSARSVPATEDIDMSPPMTRRTGTSIAAAITAGAVANLFSWALRNDDMEILTSASAKSILIRGAERDPAYSYPSRQWGYGKLDLYQSFLRMRE